MDRPFEEMDIAAVGALRFGFNAHSNRVFVVEPVERDRTSYGEVLQAFASASVSVVFPKGNSQHTMRSAIDEKVFGYSFGWRGSSAFMPRLPRTLGLPFLPPY